MYYTAVNSLDALADCRALTNLDCSNSSVVSLEPLRRFSLNRLSMENIPARDYEDLEAFADFPALTDFTFINEMPGIDSLVISDMQVPYLERDVSNRWFSLPQDND